jgi:rare lipoprotein A
MFAMSAAHRTMPIPSFARVRNPANGREVVVRINDRGPFVAGRVIDLSYAAALKLGLLNAVAPVEVERITQAEIRAREALP